MRPSASTIVPAVVFVNPRSVFALVAIPGTIALRPCHAPTIALVMECAGKVDASVHKGGQESCAQLRCSPRLVWTTASTAGFAWKGDASATPASAEWPVSWPPPSPPVSTTVRGMGCARVVFASVPRCSLARTVLTSPPARTTALARGSAARVAACVLLDLMGKRAAFLLLVCQRLVSTIVQGTVSAWVMSVCARPDSEDPTVRKRVFARTFAHTTGFATTQNARAPQDTAAPIAHSPFTSPKSTERMRTGAPAGVALTCAQATGFASEANVFASNRSMGTIVPSPKCAQPRITRLCARVAVIARTVSANALQAGVGARATSKLCPHQARAVNSTSVLATERA